MRDLPGNPISNNVSKMTDGVSDLKEDMLEEIFDLRTKLDLSLKKTWSCFEKYC